MSFIKVISCKNFKIQDINNVFVKNTIECPCNILCAIAESFFVLY